MPIFLFPLTLIFLLIIIGAVFYLIYKFITMNSSPFKAMKAIYVYIAAIIGLLLVATGFYGLIEHLLEILLTDISLDTGLLVTPIARIIIGLFIMVPHWAIGHHFHMKEHGKK